MHSRRRFLKGVGGVTVGLPFLEALLPRHAKAALGDEKPYAIFCRQGNGVAQAVDEEPERFWPSFGLGAVTGAALTADTGRAVSELGPYGDRLSLLKGIDFAFEGNGCGHSGGGNQCLTAARVSQDPSGSRSLAEGESIDNLIAKQLGGADPEPLTLYVGQKRGYLDEVLSYRGPQQLRGAENNPYNVYVDLFGLSNVDPTIVEKLRRRQKSVNDLVRGEMQTLLSRTDLSAADRQRLDLHFQSIRDIEVELVCGLGAGEVAGLKALEAAVSDDDRFADVCKAQMDLIALTLACGAKRAVTLQWGSGNDQTEHTVDGQRQKSFHKISHRIDSDGDMGPPIPNADILHHKIDRIHLSLFKYLLDKLDGYKLANGSLLDLGVTVYLNDLSQKYHSYRGVPYILVGSAGGKLKTGQYLDLGVTNNKVLNTIGAALGCTNAAGAPLDDFGDVSLSPGGIPQLVV